MGMWSLTPNSQPLAMLIKTTCQLFEQLLVRGLFDIFPAAMYDNNAAYYPKGMYQFLPDNMESLPPVDPVTFEGSTFWPTAWILRNTKWMPLEYMREDLMGVLAPPQRKTFILDKMKSHFDTFEPTLTQNIVLRQGVATTFSEQNKCGAFPDLQGFLEAVSPEYYEPSPNAKILRGALSLFNIGATLRERANVQEYRRNIRQGAHSSDGSRQRQL